MPDYSSIVTHNDFDGLGSAALLSWAYDIERIRFAGPITIAKAEIPITRDDIVCDLPYPLECGLWFDHHVGNLGELELRGLKPAEIPGRFAEALSCVRVVYDYLSETDELPEDYAELADAADVIDSFGYADLEAWRADTPANRLDRAIKASSESIRQHDEFLREATFLMRDLSLTEAADDSLVIERAQRYAREEDVMLDHISKYGKLLEHGLFIVDLTSFSNPVRIDKKLIGLVEPAAQGYAEMKPIFRRGQKTHDLSLSLSLALFMQKIEHKKDMGEIVRLLNIGDGHAGAAAGVWRCPSAHEFQKMRAELPQKILDIWKDQ
ncbi:MAG: hypothetical protein ACOZB3_03285 [Calditrichota bacterium]